MQIIVFSSFPKEIFECMQIKSNQILFTISHDTLQQTNHTKIFLISFISTVLQLKGWLVFDLSECEIAFN